MDKSNKYQELANMFAELIEKNEAPWQKAWDGNGFMPYNIKSDKAYNGINMLKLLAVSEQKGYEDNRWLTYLQASELGAKVRAGEKGMHIMYLQTTETKKKIDEKTGEEIEVVEKLERPRAMWSVVFNAEQCEGLPQLEKKQIDFNPIEKAQEILDKSGANIIHKKQNRAFYDKFTDTITLPLKEQFKSSEEYYRTALHEIGHWTGHESRNNRDLSGLFGSENYAREELVAEITSFLVGTQCGLGHEPDENNVAYIKSWSKAIRDDPSFLFQAVKDADRATKLILGKELELTQSNEQVDALENIKNILKKADKEKGFFKDLVINFAWSEKDFGIQDDTILRGEEAYEFLDKLVKSDTDQNQIQERMKKGEDIDDAYYYKTRFELSYKGHNTESIRIDIGDYEFGGKEKVSDALEHRAKMYPNELIPNDELQNFKKEEDKYLEYLQQKKSKENTLMEKQVNIKDKKYILAVPYEEKDEAKKLGAKWDKDGKFWYCQESEKEKFFKWDIKNIANKTISDIPVNIEEEFLNYIKEYGVLDNYVIADGQKHRITVDGDKGKEQSGFYVLHSDGVANGYFMNNRTGEEVKWVSKSHSISSEEKAQLKAEYQARKAKREQEDKLLTEKAEKVLYAKFMNKEAIKEHTYLTNKMIEPTNNIYAGNNNSITIPLYNIDGRLKSAQYINQDGDKRFASNTNKVGAFHIVDGTAADLKNAKSVIIAEGYATAASINEAVKKEPGIKVIASMSANNIESTVKAITEKYTGKNIIIAADNDLNNKIGNIGLNVANSVAEKYKNVTVVVPKINGKEIAGDFNDIVSKNSLSKEEAIKNIISSIKPSLNLSKTKEKEVRINKSKSIAI